MFVRFDTEGCLPTDVLHEISGAIAVVYRAICADTGAGITDAEINGVSFILRETERVCEELSIRKSEGRKIRKSEKEDRKTESLNYKTIDF